ncbi:hypothetical protein BJ170DRAFT_723817 [Xylariales sp. AK1849]|nr:hypothetical protein BJ170DRAFT_723817 [Xylariales sp. AK1849]
MEPRRSRRLTEREHPATTRKRRLEEYFEHDRKKRFHLEGYHGKGGQASVFKIKYVRPGGDSDITRSLVVKLADPTTNADVEGLKRERDLLQTMSGCKHIVRAHSITKDPLAPAAEGLGWAWMYLDMLENGTLTTFMERTKKAGQKSLPNRLLWRIFLCMIRACIAMAWPRGAPDEDGNETTIGRPSAPTGMAHNDIHGGNLMFGSYMDRPEHDISPVLRLIDFGQSELWGNKRHDSGATAEQWNIQDIGIMMATLIHLQVDSKYRGEEMEVDLSRLGRPQDAISPASGILSPAQARDGNSPPLAPGATTSDPCPHTDLDLRFIIAACMAEDPNHRPTLTELENWAFSQVRNTKPADYGAMPSGAYLESDEMIRKIVQNCIFEPDRADTNSCVQAKEISPGPKI